MLEAGYAAPELAGRAQRFADLLVRECAELVDRAMSDAGVDGRAIKEHFGVEE